MNWFRKVFLIFIREDMANKSILGFFSTKQDNKDYVHRSLFLNVEVDQNQFFNFKLFNNGKMKASGRSRKTSNTELKTEIKNYVDELTKASKILTPDSINAIQRKLSQFTDDFFPKEISDFIIENKGEYYYIVIDDEIDINIPYGILMFPDPTVKDCISPAGFFLSEYFTIVRSKQSDNSSLSISNITVLSSDDLDCSKIEEQELSSYFNKLKPGILIPIADKNHFANVLSTIQPNCLHFCCHGNSNCQIISFKNNVYEYFDMEFFSLHRFPQNTIVFLNICLSAYTTYDDHVPRSIANKFIDRNAHLVIMTEWPISDAFASLIGTKFYLRLMNKETALQAVHKLKREAKSVQDKFTAMTYSLRGNPNLRIEI